MNESEGQIRHVQLVTTLISEKIIENGISKKSLQMEEVSKDTTPEAEGKKITAEDEPKEKESMFKYVAPFPQRLYPSIKLNNNAKNFELFKHVKINIPLLDPIK